MESYQITTDTGVTLTAESSNDLAGNPVVEITMVKMGVDEIPAMLSKEHVTALQDWLAKWEAANL